MGAFETGRYERKYVVTETTAAAIRGFVSAYMLPDPHMDPANQWGYQVHSLYLDDTDFSLYHLVTKGMKNRYKLRIRFYDTAADSPAFLEVKRRDANTLYKQRAIVSKPAAESLLRGGIVGSADLLAPDDVSVRALTEFCERKARLNAYGTAFVSYRREAYVLPHAEGARVTFDRHVSGHCYYPDNGLTISDAGAVVTSHQVVLELKYIGRAPGWMKDLVRSFGLNRVSFPKYVCGVNALSLVPAIAG